MRLRLFLVAILLLLGGVSLAPPSSGTQHCPDNGIQSSSVQLRSSQHDTSTSTTFTITNPGPGNITYEGGQVSGTFYIDASGQTSESVGTVLQPGESLRVDVTAQVDPSISESTHTVDISVEFDTGTCYLDWDLTVIKDPIPRISDAESGRSLDLGEVFKGDTPSSGQRIAGIAGRVEEITGFGGVYLGAPTIDCGELSEWVSLDVSSWPSSVSAGGEGTFNAVLKISADAPYDQVRREDLHCSIESNFDSFDEEDSGTFDGAVTGEILWPAMLGPVEVPDIEMRVRSPIEDPPQTFTRELNVTAVNLGDEVMILERETHSLGQHARLVLLQSIELPAMDSFTGRQPQLVSARIELDATIPHGNQTLSGVVTEEGEGSGEVEFQANVQQPIGIRVAPEQLNLTGADAVAIGERSRLPLRVFETFGYRSASEIKIDPVDLTSTELPIGASEAGDPEWIPRSFGPRSIPPGQPYNPVGEDLRTSIQFLPGAKPGCLYGFRFQVSGQNVDPVSFDIVAEPEQPDKDEIISDLKPVLEAEGERGNRILLAFRSAQDRLAVGTEEACDADSALVSDNQRLLAVANAVITFYENGIFRSLEDQGSGQADVGALGNSAATAASALVVVDRQRASMSGDYPQATTSIQEIHSLLTERLREFLLESGELVYCDIDTCEGRIATRLSSGRLLAESARLAGISDLAESYGENTTRMDQEHRTLVQGAFERFGEADQLADQARRDHLLSVGGDLWLLNPLRYGFYMSSIDQAKRDLQQSEEEFRRLGDGAMVTATQERLAEIQAQEQSAQDSFFAASFGYLALFGLLVFHLVRSTTRYRRELQEAELGGFLRVTAAPPLLSSGDTITAPDIAFLDTETTSSGAREPDGARTSDDATGGSMTEAKELPEPDDDH